MLSSQRRSLCVAIGTVLFFLKVILLGFWEDAVTVAHARSRTGVKSTLIRDENPGTVKNHLVLPYAFSSESMGFTLGLSDTYFLRLFLSTRGMIGHYPRQRANTPLVFDQDSPRAGSNDSNDRQFSEDSGDDNWTDFKLEYVLPWA